MNAHATLALAVSLLCGTAIPAVVDLLTKSHLNSKVKALLAAALSALAGALSMNTWAPNQKWTDWVLAVGVAFVTAMAAHATHYSDGVQAATARVGIGPKNATP